jgi:hypothetical protein
LKQRHATVQLARIETAAHNIVKPGVSQVKASANAESSQRRRMPMKPPPPAPLKP